MKPFHQKITNEEHKNSWINSHATNNIKNTSLSTQCPLWNAATYN